MLLSMILNAALLGLFAVIYRQVLSYEPVLNWWFMFGQRFEQKWFYKPIWGCEKCIAGQLAAWTYVLNWIAKVILYTSPVFSHFITSIIPTYHSENYSVLEGLIFICEAIAFAIIFSVGHSKLNKQ